MYLNKQKKPNGDIYLSIREKYHVPQKGSRERTIESLGYLSELKKKYDDPIAFFTQKVREMTEEKKNNKSVRMSIDCNAKMSVQTDDIKNVGYAILKNLYKQLEIDKFWNWKTKNLSIVYLLMQTITNSLIMTKC